MQTRTTWTGILATAADGPRSARQSAGDDCQGHGGSHPKDLLRRQRRGFCLSLGGKNDGCALRILRNMQELKTQESLLPPANVADERGGRADAAGRRVTQD